MRSICLHLTIPDRPAAAVFSILADFNRYPEFSPAVRSVSVEQSADNTTISRWEVNFRRGILRWVEEDTFDVANHEIHFRQLEGDIAVFDGSWSCRDDDGNTRIVFSARLDMGIPSLADALEPIAVRTLIDNTVAIVSGLFEGNVTVEDSRTEGLERAAGPVR